MIIKDKRKLAAAIACRNQGSRLYGKPLQNLDIEAGVCILDQIIDCLNNFECINSIVLGVSEGTDNHSFIDFAKKRGINHIIGCQKDVLSRLIACGEAVSATDIFRTTSESPFPYYELIEEAWNQHVDNNFDATFLDDIIDGTGFEIISMQTLMESHNKGQNRHKSELCSLYVREHKDLFNVNILSPPVKLIRKDLRLTVDYPEDLVLCRAVYEKFKRDAPLIPLLDVVNFLDDNKGLKQLTAKFCEEGYSTMYL